ncbi:ABC transporter substrate-binding protein [Mesorhizobium sp. SB112]|uniref:ABC transporter substrate-binding protein n=1 Tax=Mesorhizobium sp. SB112 TaxID=3151853 RepID=UPI003264BFCC
MKRTLMVGVMLTTLSLYSAPASAELKFAPGEDARFTWSDYETLQKTDLSGQTLTVFGPWRGPDEELAQSILEYFREATGATVNYSSSENYEQQIVIDTQAGSPPNIAILPQPGLIQDLASKGLLTPLGDETQAWVAQNYGAGESWVDLGTYNDKDGKPQFFALPYKADVKSLVWYSPDNFEDAGYEIPESMEDLLALQEKIVADGGVPWCIGLGSGGATGWPATDWVEDIMLRINEPSVYDQWTTNEIPFNDPKVVEALEIFASIATKDENVDGGAAAVSATDFRDSPKGLFGIPPKCYMHHQASFIPSFFPEGTELGVDADFFYMPAYADKDLGKPVLGAGTLAMITKDSDAARAFIEFLKMPLAHELWMAQSGFVTPHKGVNAEAYANDALKKQGQILAEATTFRFDGSDLMPGKIGAGAFWKGMVDLVGGKPAKQVADEIQQSWDSIK